MRRSVALILFGAAAVGLFAAGCGSGSYGSNSSSTQTSTPVASKSASLTLGSTSLGKVLVGAGGRTLYLFEKDTGGKSSCTGGCAAEWPPFTTTGKPSAGAGVDASMLSVTKRSDGKSQVVYAGHPLYFYSGGHEGGRHERPGPQRVRRRVVRGVGRRQQGDERLERLQRLQRLHTGRLPLLTASPWRPLLRSQHTGRRSDWPTLVGPIGVPALATRPPC